MCCAYDSIEAARAQSLVVTVGLRDLLVLLKLCLVIQTPELPLGKGDTGLLVDGLHQRRQHLVDV